MCRHAFAALQQCSIHSIPRHLVKPRWTKNAITVHSTLGSSGAPLNTATHDMKRVKRTRAWFEFNNCLDYAGDDEEKLDAVMTCLKEISTKLQTNGENKDVQSLAHRTDKFIGPIPQNDDSIQNPLISRNKGCGNRIKSSKEISIKARKPRTCSLCNKTEGHNACTCPISKASK